MCVFLPGALHGKAAWTKVLHCTRIVLENVVLRSAVVSLAKPRDTTAHKQYSRCSDNQEPKPSILSRPTSQVDRGSGTLFFIPLSVQDHTTEASSSRHEYDGYFMQRG